MRILISNDDGIDAPGLAALAACVADLGEVTIVAPLDVQSAAGHRITLKDTMSVRRVHLDAGGGFDALGVQGSPADCVRLAIRNLMPQPPQVVLAGINAGVNVGFNVFYSGTVAAAGEATMWGLPAVAFSAWAGGGPIDYARCGRLCRWVLDGLRSAGLLESGGAQGRGLLNVNLPAQRPSWPRGMRICRQSRAKIDDVYDDQGGAYRLNADYCFNAPSADTDVCLLEEGFITVTPLQMDLTDHAALPGTAALQFGQPPP